MKMQDNKEEVIIVEPINLDRGVVSLKGYDHPLGGVTVYRVPFGKIKLDDKGEPVFSENALVPVRPFELNIKPGEVLRLNTKKDADVIEALKNCPHREGITKWVDPITGQEYDLQELKMRRKGWFAPRFRIIDPSAEARKHKAKLDAEAKVFEYVMTMPAALAKYNMRLLGIQVDADMEDITHKAQLSRMAIDRTEDFHAKVMHNREYELDMLITLARARNLIRYADGKGFSYVTGNTPYMLGLTHDAMKNRVKDDETIYDELTKSLGDEWEEFVSLISGNEPAAQDAEQAPVKRIGRPKKTEADAS
jgi:hypothetical protein